MTDIASAPVSDTRFLPRIALPDQIDARNVGDWMDKLGGELLEYDGPEKTLQPVTVGEFH